MRRDACAACDGQLMDFLDLGSSPLADRFPASASAKETWYPLDVAVCLKCWLVQLREVVPDEELYGEDYGFRTGSSPVAVGYYHDLAAKLLRDYGPQARQLTVEIACNDGTLLGNFEDVGCPVFGIEPSGAAESAPESIPVVRAPFSHSLVQELGGRKAGLVLAFNVVAHVTDPLDFLKGVRELLADDGVAVIEFQDLDSLVAGCQFDHVYHEHRFYYSRGSLSRLAWECGLEVVSWERTPAQGGSVRVYLSRRGSRFPWFEPWLHSVDVYLSMQGRADFARRRLNELIEDELGQGRVIAGYGASAKSATLLNFCGLTSRKVRWVEDLTPAKIGRFTPGSHIPIRRPGSAPSTYLLTSHNYLSAVLRKEGYFLHSGGRFIVPGAVPVIL